ncbi:MAG: tRNA (adenosine(37)-N6)-threonylcarbamoyltransferase complex dimerization subunit type 1 TsaB [Sphingomonas sp.]
MELVIDTATAACSVALIDGGAIVDQRHETVGRGHAERLMPEIASLLEGRAPPRAVRVDCGPGSFTGVRVGLAAARALGLAWGVPVHGYSATALIAAGMFAEDAALEALTVAMIGGHGEMFVQRFAQAPFAARTALASLSPEAAAALADHCVAGSAAVALVQARGHGEAREILPRAADVRLLPASFAALPPVPIYGRAPDAKAPGAA